MNHILCPVDFSDSSMNAVNSACLIAGKTDASVTLLHIEPVTRALLKGKEESLELQEMVQQFRDNLASYCDNLSNEFNIQCNYVISDNSLEDEIHELTEKDQFNLIVMGSDGISDYEQLYFGSNSSRVLEHTNCALLVIPVQVKNPDFSKIVFACDYQQGSDIYIQNLLVFAQYFDADIDVLHVSKADTEISKEVFLAFKDQFETKYGISNRLNFRQYFHGDVEWGIEHYAKENNANLIAMVTHHRSLLGELINPSITLDMVMTIELPMLVFHQ